MKKDKQNEKHVSLRVDADLLRRFSYVAKYHDRSMNGMVLSLMRRSVAQYEEKYGKIEFPEEEE